jgi:hypothetical protein
VTLQDRLQQLLRWQLALEALTEGVLAFGREMHRMGRAVDEASDAFRAFEDAMGKIDLSGLHFGDLTH